MQGQVPHNESEQYGDFPPKVLLMGFRSCLGWIGSRRRSGVASLSGLQGSRRSACPPIAAAWEPLLAKAGYSLELTGALAIPMSTSSKART